MRNRLLMAAARYTIPYLYLAYIRLVWATSKIIQDETGAYAKALATKPYKFVGALWHQDVFCVPWVYRNFKPHTIASVGDAGAIITEILKKCKFTAVVRGGSSHAETRHRQILPELIAMMQEAPCASCGITVDGSQGPAYRLKRGALVLAKECQIPMFAARIWCKRKLLLPTWDRTMIPLPFNRFVIFARGPYYLPADIDDPRVFENFRTFIENELLTATYQSIMAIDGEIPPQLRAFFPENWIADYLAKHAD